MREIRQSGSEGGGAETNRLSLPLFGEHPRGEPFLTFSDAPGVAGINLSIQLRKKRRKLGRQR